MSAGEEGESVGVSLRESSSHHKSLGGDELFRKASSLRRREVVKENLIVGGSIDIASRSISGSTELCLWGGWVEEGREVEERRAEGVDRNLGVHAS